MDELVLQIGKYKLADVDWAFYVRIHYIQYDRMTWIIRIPKIIIKITSYQFKYYSVPSNKNTFCCAKNPTKDKTFCYVEAKGKKN